MSDHILNLKSNGAVLPPAVGLTIVEQAAQSGMNFASAHSASGTANMEAEKNLGECEKLHIYEAQLILSGDVSAAAAKEGTALLEVIHGLNIFTIGEVPFYLPAEASKGTLAVALDYRQTFPLGGFNINATKQAASIRLRAPELTLASGSARYNVVYSTE